jgi:ornithine carbamoyltransferase
MARLLHNSDLQKIVSSSQVPVINGCCEKFHPCQALTDVFTMKEHFDGDISEATLAFVGVQNNVSNSLAVICDKLGIQLHLATPQGADTSDNGENRDADVNRLLAESSHIHQTRDPSEAVAEADFVYTDTWVDMEFFNDPNRKQENERKLAEMMPYQINPSLVQGVNCRIMHDMPIHEGFEISADMARDPRSIIFEQAANRLHAQKGLLHWIYQEAGIIPA